MTHPPLPNWQVYRSTPASSPASARAHFDGAGALFPSAWQGTLSLTAGLNGLFVGLWGQADTLLVDVSTLAAGAVLLTAYVLALRRVKP